MQNLGRKNRRIVRLLTAILRIADGLDRQHNQCVDRIEARQEGPKHLSVSLVTEEPAFIPLRAAVERSGLLQKELNLKRIDFHIRNARAAAHATAG